MSQFQLFRDIRPGGVPHFTERYLPVECYASASDRWRPRPIAIEGVVLHYISVANVDPERKYETDRVWEFFRDMGFDASGRIYGFNSRLMPPRRAAISAHLLITRSGRILQTVPLTFQAFHAGVSEFKGRQGCNAFMVGIELIGAHEEPFANEQYAAAAWVCRRLMQRFHFPSSHIVGHQDVAPGRKKDPGPSFEWERFRKYMQDWEV